jgi:hypothetical protein
MMRPPTAALAFALLLAAVTRPAIALAQCASLSERQAKLAAEHLNAGGQFISWCDECRGAAKRPPKAKPIAGAEIAKRKSGFAVLVRGLPVDLASVFARSADGTYHRVSSLVGCEAYVAGGRPDAFSHGELRPEVLPMGSKADGCDDRFPLIARLGNSHWAIKVPSSFVLGWMEEAQDGSGRVTGWSSSDGVAKLRFDIAHNADPLDARLERLESSKRKALKRFPGGYESTGSCGSRDSTVCFTKSLDLEREGGELDQMTLTLEVQGKDASRCAAQARRILDAFVAPEDGD